MDNFKKTTKEEKEALGKAYERAIELSPSYAKAYNNLGVAYKSIGKHPEAIAS